MSNLRRELCANWQLALKLESAQIIGAEPDLNTTRS